MVVVDGYIKRSIRGDIAISDFIGQKSKMAAARGEKLPFFIVEVKLTSYITTCHWNYWLVDYMYINISYCQLLIDFLLTYIGKYNFQMQLSLKLFF